MFERGEADLCLLVGGESVPEMSSKARRHLETIPTILLDYPTVQNSFQPQIKSTTAAYGVHLSGTVYRMDEVPIPLRKILTTHYPSDADVLERIMESFEQYGT